MKKNQEGISLLEIMLSLLIAAAFIMITVNYYISQNRIYTDVAKAASQIQHLADISYEWQTAQSETSFRSISIDALEDAGLLPKGDVYSETNPWGGSIVVAPDRNPQYLNITLNGIPSNACANLYKHMQNVAHNQQCQTKKYIITL